MTENSFALLRTNVGLTTNVKFMVSGPTVSFSTPNLSLPTYKMYLESIDSHPELSKIRFKKQSIIENADYTVLLKNFYTGVPSEIAYFIKDDDDADTMSTNFQNQIDDLYHYGAKNITNNKNYEEEFEYFAPLHVTQKKIPTHFVIFRIDGPGIAKITRNNFRDEVLNKMKVVSVIDMSINTNLGKMLNKTINLDTRFLDTCLHIDFKRNELSSWYGFDYDAGGYGYEKENLETFFSREKTFTQIDSYLTKSWQNKKIIYPYIFNFSFLFDDTPATPTSLRKWSLNRYLGFYFDEMQVYQQISLNPVTPLQDDVFIAPGNILKTTSGSQPFSNPDNITNYPYVEVDGKRYKVLECPCGEQTVTTEKTQTSSSTSEDQTKRSVEKCWKIIADVNLEGKSLKPTVKKPNSVNIKTEEGITTIFYTDETPFLIPEFEDYDMWLVKMGDVFHKLIKDSTTGNIQIYSDYEFLQSATTFEYWINDPDPLYRKKLTNSDNTPVSFIIYRGRFTNIKDFDTDIIETKFARYEYEKEAEVSRSAEEKFYMTNYSSKSIPPETHEFKIGNENIYIPCSSHYTANLETFTIYSKNNPNNPNLFSNPNVTEILKLNDLWKKNPKVLKWGYLNSLSHGDTPYLLNNSISADSFNRSCNTSLLFPSRIEKNLDYFYSVNSDSSDYVYQGLHVEDQTNGQININFQFELDKYLGVSYSGDYFSYFFGKRNETKNGEIVRNDNKFSIINSSGFDFESNNTVFKGLKFTFAKVTGINVSSKVDSIRQTITNDLTNYKFSVLFSKTNYDFEYVPLTLPTTGLFGQNSQTVVGFVPKPYKTINNLKWETIKEWQTGTTYATNSIIRWNDMLFETFTQSTIPGGVKTPNKATNIDVYSKKNIFWSPIFDGTDLTTKNNVSELKKSTDSFTLYPVVFNEGEYWWCTGDSELPVASESVGILFSPGLRYNFWNPYRRYNANKTGTTIAKVTPSNCVLHKNKVWTSEVPSNDTEPTETNPKWKERASLTNGYNDPFFRVPPIKITFGSSGDPKPKVPYLFPIWKKVPLWRPNNPLGFRENFTSYPLGFYVAVRSNEGQPDLYVCIQSNSSSQSPPDVPTLWRKVHGFTVDQNYTYGASFSSNDLLRIDGKLWKVDETLYVVPDEGVRLGKPLNNGIDIYINKRWKNVLVNIYSNDGLLDNYVSNVSRDSIYVDECKKLTAKNLIDYINNLELNYGFSKKLRYIIINENGDFSIHDFNDLNTVKLLPYIVRVLEPDSFPVLRGSLKKTPAPINQNNLKPNKVLNDGQLLSLDQLNFYSDVPYAYTITPDSIASSFPPGFLQQANNSLVLNMYRHTGYYSPIFHDVQLFKAPGPTQSYVNFKFDTDLTEFGMTGEVIVSKTNRNSNILKLKDSTTIRSVFPMLDEVGYQVVKKMIFKSTWDFEYLQECYTFVNQNPINSGVNINPNNQSTE